MSAVNPQKTIFHYLEKKGAPPLRSGLLADFFQAMVSGQLPESVVENYLLETHRRGESAEELLALVNVLREHMVTIPGHEDAFDTCGTGGSGLPRFNTSTCVAFVLAAGGVKVAKHGNRAASGRCGSFDLLEELGCRIELSPAQVDRTLSTLGIGFLFARLYHPVLKSMAPIRQKLQVRTIFNSVGPLLNPCRVRRQLMGISQGASFPFRKEESAPHFVPCVMEVFKSLGHERVGIVHGQEGLDEVTLTGPTSLLELRRGETLVGELTPEKYGFSRVPFKALEGGDRVENARTFLSILEGRDQGPLYDLVCFNAGLGFFLADRTASIEEGILLAREMIDSKKAQQCFTVYRDLTQTL